MRRIDLNEIECQYQRMRKNTAGSWAGLLALGGVAVLTACGGSDDSETTAASLASQQLIAHVGQVVVEPRVVELAQVAGALGEAGAAWGAAPGDASLRDRAQDAWRTAIAAVQRLEPLQVGPAGMSGALTGGADLRDAMYSWPTVNACKVDRLLFDGAQDQEGFLQEELVDVRGLDALEYLLFQRGAENACGPDESFNANDAWAALGQAEIERRRAVYVRQAAAICASAAEDLRRAWQQDDGGFGIAWRTAGQGSELFNTAQMAVDDLFAALLYVDTSLRDLKLAEPLGRSGACATPPCLDEVESFWARASRAHVRHNLEGLSLGLVGVDVRETADADVAAAPGFDGMLREVGAAEQADRLVELVRSAFAAEAALRQEATLSELLEADDPGLDTLYDAVKGIADFMKIDLVTLLNLRLPNQGAGDND